MRRIYAASLILIAIVASARADGVKVNRPAPVVQHKTFDRKNPPKDMPPLEGEEAAVTKSIFGIESEFSILVEPAEKRGAKTINKVKIAGVNATLSLKITVWVPEDAAKVIVEHEEGHRQISEYFYKDAEKVARSIAGEYVGQTYSVEGEDIEAASKKALDKVLTEMSQKYMGQTQVISGHSMLIS